MIMAQVVNASSIGYWLIFAIVFAAIIGITYIILKQMGIPIPTWANQVLWIIIVVIVGVVAIRFLLSLL